MALHEFRIADNVLDASINASTRRIAALIGSKIRVWYYDVKSKTAPNDNCSAASFSADDDHIGRQVAFVGESEVYVLMSQANSTTITVTCVNLVRSETATGTFESNDGYATFFSSSDRTRLYLQIGGGLLFELSKDDSTGTLNLTARGKLPSFSAWVEEVRINDKVRSLACSCRIFSTS